MIIKILRHMKLQRASYNHIIPEARAHASSGGSTSASSPDLSCIKYFRYNTKVHG